MDKLPAMTGTSIQVTEELEQRLLTMPQDIIETQHTLHAGVYTRTIRMPKGQLLTGALVKCSTNLIVSGHVKVTVGDEVYDVRGYASIPAAANRKQAFLAVEETFLTMYFSTKAVTIEEAEREFTDEHERLMSRLPDSINHVTITGE